MGHDPSGHGHKQELREHVGRLFQCYCVPNMRTLLSQVDVTKLTDAQVEELRKFDFHYLPETGSHSNTFAQGDDAVAIIKGIREGLWTKEQVQTALPN